MTDSTEEESIKRFLELVNLARGRAGVGPISRPTAVKFLTARKFNIDRALSLFEQYQRVRISEELYDFQPIQPSLQAELESGKFTVLPGRDVCGAFIALFTARLHYPQLTSHRDTLRALMVQLDTVIRDEQAQRCGLVFIYDMTGSKYANFDYDLSQKILAMLKGAYPARLKKVLIVTAPLWFRAPFKILRLFVREKLRDRVWTISRSQLPLHIAESVLPQHIGGSCQLDHDKWLQRCYASMTECSQHDNELCDIPLSRSSSTGVSSLGGGCQNTSDRVSDTDEAPSGVCGENHCSDSSGFSDDDSLHVDDGRGCSLADFIEQLAEKNRSGLYREYGEIKSVETDGTFCHSLMSSNRGKNRYSDVLCLDHSRVVLSQIEDDVCSDYINANFVDGYKQRNAFISTQGPLPATFADFWRMVWEQRVQVISMTTRLVEQGRTKCGRYWPLSVGEQCDHGSFSLINTAVDQMDSCIVSKLLLTDSLTQQTRPVMHYLFTAWPDYNVPHCAADMLEFLSAVRATQARMVAEMQPSWTGHPLGPPILVHCSAGIGRTGTFITLDICTRRLEDVGTVDVAGTVAKVRQQRALSIQMPDQFVFCHTALVDYALARGLLSPLQLTHVPIMVELAELAKSRAEPAALQLPASEAGDRPAVVVAEKQQKHQDVEEEEEQDGDTDYEVIDSD